MASSSSTPKITIGILCYNAQETISKAVESAFAQDYSNFEVIVVDDCSEDASVEQLKKYQKIKNFRLIQHSVNTGSGGARNTVVKTATGSIIVFFDDDDLSRKDRLKVQLQTLTKHEERLQTDRIACYASSQRVYSNGYQVTSYAIGSTGDEVPHGPAMALYLLAYEKRKGWYFGAGTPSSSLMIRKDFLLMVGGFDETLRRVEDVDLAIRLALADGHFVGSREILVERHMTQSNYKSAQQNLFFERQLVENFRDILSEKRLFYHAYQWPLLRYHHFRRNYFYFGLVLIGLFLHNPLKTSVHLLSTGPLRLVHERKMQISDC